LRFQRRITRHGIEPHKRLKCLNLPFTAFYMTAMYLFTKAIYLLNVFIQLYAMNKFLETDKEGWYGLQVIRDLINGIEWGASGFFPRVSLCDFTVRQVANIQRYSVQCVLVINIFNEKIFILMWFWYMFLMLATVLSFAYWFLLMMLPFCGRSFVSQHLELSELPFDSKRDKKTVDKFVDHYLRTDGIFVLRMVSMHAGIIFGTDLVTNLWAKFNGIEEEAQRILAQAKADAESDNKINSLSSHLRKRKHDKKTASPSGKSDTIITNLIPTSPDYESSSSSSDEAPPVNRDGMKL